MQAKAMAIHHFTCLLGLVQHAATHTAQKHFTEMEDNTKDFIVMMRVKVQERNPNNILNMDQMPIPFSYHDKCTWEEKGVKMVHTQSSNSETKRATLAATVTMSDEVLPPLLIFKGEKNGRIEKKELPNLPPMCLYAVQKKAWMDESMMLLWIEQCLSPWKATLPPHTVPLLILDSFCVHMMGSIVEDIQALGVEVQYIPGGCTYLCQPIDVGVNRPIKHAMAEQWEDWIDSKGVQNHNVMATSPHELIATWVVKAYWTLKTETCKKAWTKKGFEWTV